MTTVSDGVLVEDGNGKMLNDLESAKFTKEKETVDVIQPTVKLIGLTKEQLEQYRNDPFWKAIRYALFVAFWLVWFIMFVGVILIVVMSPKCVDVKWENKMISYKIFTLAFKHSEQTFLSKNGFGDFIGIKEKLEDLKNMGVDVIWPTPVLEYNKNKPELSTESNMKLEVSKELGGEDKLQELIKAAHVKDMKVILDIPLSIDNEISNWMGIEHPVIKDTGKVLPLNLKDERVKNALLSLISEYNKWGVDGIHLAGTAVDETNLPDFVKIVLDQTKEKGIPIYSEQNIKISDANYYQILSLVGDKKINGVKELLVNLHGNLELVQKQNNMELELNKNVPADKIVWRLGGINANQERIDELLEKASLDDDQKRHISFLLTLIQLFVPGPINILYGEELDLLSGESKPSKSPKLYIYPWEETEGKDIENNQFFVLPRNASLYNYKAQIENSISPLNIFKTVAKLHQHNEFILGDFNLIKVNDTDGVYVYSLKRYPKNNGYYGLMINWDSKDQTIPGETISRLYDNFNMNKITILTSTNDKLSKQKKLCENDDGPCKVEIPPYNAVILNLHDI